MKIIKVLWRAAKGTLIACYFLGCIAIAVTSGVAAQFYWQNWWMLPVQIVVGLFLFILGIVVVDGDDL